MQRRRSLFLLLALVALVAAAWSYLLLAQPQPRTLDQRVNDVASQLKCPVCQNESVADSSAAIAEQMRLVIRQQLAAGQSEQHVLQYFAAHYGEQILLTPPQSGLNLLAWLVPVGMLLLGLGLLVLVVRDWRTQSLAQLARRRDETTSDLHPELEQYRTLLEQELAAEDPALFVWPGVEAE